MSLNENLYFIKKMYAYDHNDDIHCFSIIVIFWFETDKTKIV